MPQARKLCPGAIVGTGSAAPSSSSPNRRRSRPPRRSRSSTGPASGGDPSVLAHAYTTVPAPTTFIVPVRIETIHNGRYGYRVKAEIPKIAGGAGIPISGSIRVGRKWTYKGKKHSYINARCADGRLQAIGKFGFKDGTRMKGTFLSPCQIRG